MPSISPDIILRVTLSVILLYFSFIFFSTLSFSLSLTYSRNPNNHLFLVCPFHSSSTRKYFSFSSSIFLPFFFFFFFFFFCQISSSISSFHLLFLYFLLSFPLFLAVLLSPCTYMHNNRNVHSSMFCFSIGFSVHHTAKVGGHLASDLVISRSRVTSDPEAMWSRIVSSCCPTHFRQKLHIITCVTRRHLETGRPFSFARFLAASR